MTVRHTLQLGLFLLSLWSIQARAEGKAQMEFAYYTDTIYATGDIDADAATRLSDLVKAKKIPAGTVVAFNSPGGSVVGGMHLGEAIRDLKLNTNVFRYVGPSTYRGEDGLAPPITFDRNDSAECASACVYAYLGGALRYLYSESRLGIHQFFFPAGTKSVRQDSQVLSATIVAYLNEMGVTPLLFTASALYGENEMRYLSRQEAEDYGLVNNGVISSVIHYQVSKGRPFLELAQDTDIGKFKIGLLCQEKQLYVGASRDVKSRSVLDDPHAKQYFWMDDKQAFEMDGTKDTFYQPITTSELAELFASRRIRIWTEGDGARVSGGELLIKDWSLFRDYANACGV